jgi:hypothetical protein
MAKLTEEGLKGLNKQLKNNTITQEEYNKKLKEYFEIEEEVNAETIKLAQSQKRVAEIMGDSLAAYEANNDILKQFKEITGDAYESTENLTQAQIEAIEIAGFQADAFIQLAKEAQKYKDEIDALGPAYKDALKKSKPFFEDIATKMGLLSKSSNKFIGKIVELGGLAKDPNGLKGLAQGFKEVFNPLNVGISILSKVAESTFKMMFAVDKAGSEFVKTTGFARNFDDLIASTNDTMRQFGVSAEDAGKAIAELRQGLSQFNTLGTETQQKLTSTVAGLAEIGVSMSDSTETITALNKAFGVSADQAADMTREIALSGDVLGKTASQITKDYNKALSTLAVYGTKSVKIFGNIASMAAAAGVEVDTLLSIADKFETFSDAAQTAAKMNAILGTSFSGMNLQMMDHDKRVEEVIRGLQSTGKAFKDLDKFTQQAIATQLGIKNMKEAQQILGVSVSEHRRLQKEQAATAKKQEALNEKMAKAMSITAKLKEIMADFAINMEPMIPTIRKIVQGLGDFILFLKDLHPLTIAGGAAFMAFGGAALNMLGTVTKIKVVSKVAGKSIEGVGKSIGKTLETVGASAAKASPGIGTLSISMGGIALVIGVAGAAVAGITLSFAFLFKTLIDGVIALKAAGVGFGEAAMGAGLFAAGIISVAVAMKTLAASTGLLQAMGPLGLAVGGILAAGFGAAALLSGGDGGAPLDSKGLIDNADKITTLSSKLKELSDNKEGLQSTFAAIGTGLEIAKNSLNADIQSTLANVALITTGQAAGEMNQGAAGAALSRNLGKFIDSVGDYFSGEKDKDKTMKLQLDGKATTDLFDGRIAVAHMKP